MRRLLVMRHAKSDWSDPSLPDADRPLNERGRMAASKMAGWIAERGLTIDRVVSSSSLRTRQTVGHLVDGLALATFRDDLYLADADRWIDVIRALEVIGPAPADTVLICGHNPGLDDLVEWLSAAEPPRTGTGKLMTTAAIADLTFDTSWSDVGAHTGRLVDLVRPRELP